MHAARLTGLDWHESRTLLDAVYLYLYSRGNVMEHKWYNGDIVIWDNITYQHARGSLDGIEPRVLQRVILGVEGRAPHLKQMDAK